MNPVRSWPSYILRVPEDVRAAVSQEAQERDLSVAETLRGILCEHYGLDCPPVTLRRGGAVGYDPERDTGSTTIVLRVQPDLFRAIKRDANRRRKVRKTMRECILEALQAHYTSNGGTPE